MKSLAINNFLNSDRVFNNDRLEPTTGANGDVTSLTLPGNLIVSFTGHNVRHADGRQLQRIGIQPTVKVVPTIRGWIDGEDEILDAASKFLQTAKN